MWSIDVRAGECWKRQGSCGKEFGDRGSGLVVEGRDLYLNMAESVTMVFYKFINIFDCNITVHGKRLDQVNIIIYQMEMRIKGTIYNSHQWRKS